MGSRLLARVAVVTTVVAMTLYVMALPAAADASGVGWDGGYDFTAQNTALVWADLPGASLSGSITANAQGTDVLSLSSTAKAAGHCIETIVSQDPMYPFPVYVASVPPYQPITTVLDYITCQVNVANPVSVTYQPSSAYLIQVCVFTVTKVCNEISLDMVHGPTAAGTYVYWGYSSPYVTSYSINVGQTNFVGAEAVAGPPGDDSDTRIYGATLNYNSLSSNGCARAESPDYAVTRCAPGSSAYGITEPAFVPPEFKVTNSVRGLGGKNAILYLRLPTPAPIDLN